MWQIGMQWITLAKLSVMKIRHNLPGEHSLRNFRETFTQTHRMREASADRERLSSQQTVRVTEIISDTFQCRRQFRQINFVFFYPCHDGSMRAYRLRFNWVWFIGIFRLTTTTIQYVRIECVMFMSVDDLNIRWLQWLEWSCNKSNYRYISYVV